MKIIEKYFGKDQYLFDFKDSQKPPVKVKVLSKERIGEGDMGSVYKIKIKMGKKYGLLAMKEYKKLKFLPEEMRPDNEERINLFKNVFTRLKKANIPTFNTFRFNKEKDKVYMSLENLDPDLLVVGISGSDDSEDARFLSKEKNKIEGISNKESFFKELGDIIDGLKKEKLICEKIDLAWFYFNKKTKELNMKITDLDMIQIKDNFSDTYFEDNKESILRSLYRFEKKFMKESKESLGDEFLDFLKNKEKKKNFRV